MGKTNIKSVSRCLFHIAEFISAMMLAVIFMTFLIQIFTRYAPDIAWLVPIYFISEWMLELKPLGWTVNLISLVWVWGIFWGCSFIVRENEHITFDILYFAAPAKTQRIFAIASSLTLITIMFYSLPTLWELVFQNRLMELKKIQTLYIPITRDRIAIKWLFAAFILFMVATIIRYTWKIIAIAQNKDIKKEDIL